MVASGTASLECALYRKPMVIAYRVAAGTYWLAKKLVKLPYVGLPNILEREFVVPEFIQDDARAELLAPAVRDALDNVARRRLIEERFGALHARLRCNTGERAARVLSDLIKKS